MKHFTLESASLHSIHGTNVVNSQTLYFSILSYRPFFSAYYIIFSSPKKLVVANIWKIALHEMLNIGWDNKAIYTNDIPMYNALDG